MEVNKNIVDLEIEKSKIGVKVEVLTDLEECFLKYRDKMGNITEEKTDEMAIPNIDLEKYFKYVFDKDYNFHSDNLKVDISEDEFLEKFNLKDDLPNFQVFLYDELVYDRDDNKSYDINNLKERVLEVENKEYWDNMDLKDIRSFEVLANKGALSVFYERGIDSNSCFEHYTNFEDYCEEIIDIKKKEIIDKEVQEIKEELKEKIDIDNNCIKTKSFFELKEKYQEDFENKEKELKELKGIKEKNMNSEEKNDKKITKDNIEMKI